MFWKITIILISESAIEKDTNAIQKWVSEKEAFCKDHTSLSLLLFRFLYCWAFDLFNHSDYHRELELANETIVKWKKSVKEICAYRFLQHPPIIGWLGNIVEINESLLVRRKYNVGHLVREQWVFGGYDNTNKVEFLVPVERRNKDTLLIYCL